MLNSTAAPTPALAARTRMAPSPVRSTARRADSSWYSCMGDDSVTAGLRPVEDPAGVKSPRRVRLTSAPEGCRDSGTTKLIRSSGALGVEPIPDLAGLAAGPVPDPAGVAVGPVVEMQPQRRVQLEPVGPRLDVADVRRVERPRLAEPGQRSQPHRRVGAAGGERFQHVVRAGVSGDDELPHRRCGRALDAAADLGQDLADDGVEHGRLAQGMPAFVATAEDDLTAGVAPVQQRDDEDDRPARLVDDPAELERCVGHEPGRHPLGRVRCVQRAGEASSPEEALVTSPAPARQMLLPRGAPAGPRSRVRSGRGGGSGRRRVRRRPLRRIGSE